MAARADAVVVAKDGLADAFPAAEIVPVRNYAAAVPVAPREHRAGPLTLVHLGALTRERGAFEMLRALALCPPGTRLALIGRFTDGSEAEFLAEAERRAWPAAGAPRLDAARGGAGPAAAGPISAWCCSSRATRTTAWRCRTSCSTACWPGSP